ncbi:MAG: DMT family transporter [Prevotellaceae bacterium]|jgi:drug/metabolite transporter (DMT)-like permease|nr:DMT family transporter [Prevotellaceae bacterium]
MNYNKSAGHVSLFLTNAIFGINTAVSRSLVPDVVHPLVVAFLRTAGALLLFWSISFFMKKERVPKKDLLLMFFASIFAIGLNQTMFIIGLSMTSPIDAAIEQTFLPILSMFLAACFLKEPITWKKALGVCIGAVGVLTLILGHVQTAGSRSILGNGIIFVGVLSFSLYLTLFKELTGRYSPVTLMKWMFLFSAVPNFLLSYEALVATDFSAISLDSYLRIGYIVVFATFLAYLLIPVGQKTLRPTTISMYSYVQPVISAFVSIVIGIEAFGVDKLLSAVLVFTGVFLVTKSKSRAQMEAEIHQPKSG